MKKIIPIFLLLFVCTFNTNAQLIDTLPWCPDGATWVYMQPKLGATYLNKLVYEKDTLIDSFLTKKISLYSSYSLGGNPLVWTSYEKTLSYFIRNSNDSIYFYEIADWSLKYFFNPTENSKWYVEVDDIVCNELSNNDTLQVVSLTDTTINNVTYKNITTSSAHQNIEIGSILNNIGPLNNFIPIPMHWNCDNPIDETFGLGNLICYRDNLRGNAIGNNNCENIISTVYELNKEYKIYPNPTKGIILIDVANDKTIDIFDFSGRFIRTEKIVNRQIDISDLQSGLFYLLFSENKNFVYHKIFKL